MQSDKRIRAALVGAGYVSEYHLKALNTLPFVQVVGIADLDLDRAAKLAAVYRIPKVCRTLQELAEAKPDAIHVLTPPASHCELTLQALDMGCHVLVEKPMAMSTEECDLMIAKAKRTGKIVSINHSARLDPIVQHALSLVRSGEIGDIVSVDFLRSSSYPPYPGGPLPVHYRQGGYPFRDLGSHGLYLLEAFLGEIQDLSVQHKSSGRDPNLVFDEWRTLARCEKGFGQIQISWNVRPMQSELVIQGTKGVLRVDRFFQTCRVQRDLPGPKSAGRVINAASSAFGSVWDFFSNTVKFATKLLVPSPGIHQGVIEFHKSLAAGTPPPVSAEEGRRNVYWTEIAARPADVDKQTVRSFSVSREHDVLVTGGTGFLGRVVVKKLLESGHKVRLLVRRQPASAVADDPRVQVLIGDLGDPDIVDLAVRGTRVVYHVGAAMGGGQADFERGTVAGTRNIVASCLRHNVERLVHVSSLGVLDYCGASPDKPITESSPVEPHPGKRGHYTATKLAAETIVLDSIRNDGLKAVILRPGQIFGPGSEKFAPYGTIPLGKHWVVVGSGDCKLPLVYVDDVADALLLAAKAGGVCGSIFHLVDDTVITQTPYLSARLKGIDDGVKVHYVPKFVLYCAALAAETLGKLMGRGVPLTRYRLDALKSLRFNCTAAKTKLQWVPAVGVQEGMKRTFSPAPPSAAVQTTEPQLTGTR